MAETPWLEDYEQRIREIGARARQVHTALDGLTATAGAAGGAVTVTVNPSGVLQRLTFTERAEELSRPALADAVVEAARHAHAEVARRSVDALRPLVGGSEAERILAGHLPAQTVPTAGDE